MSLEKMELLELKIRNTVELISKLKEENSSLGKRVEDLEQELSSKTEALNSLNAEKEKVDTIVSESKQLEAERDMIKSKIEDMISNLEEIDLG
jgi:FtsZ-binding cell division protein ZapB